MKSGCFPIALFVLVAVPACLMFGQFRNVLDAERVKTRIAELSPPDKGIPESEYSLIEEQRTLRAEIEELRTALGAQPDSGRTTERIDKTKNSVASLLAELTRIDCANTRDFDIGMKLAQEVSVMSGPFLFDAMEVPSTWVGMPQPQATCATWKAFAGGVDRQKTLLGYFDSLREKLSEAAKQRADEKARALPLMDLLQKRRDAIDKQLSTKSTQGSITNNLWSVLLIIGFFSLGTILAVKLFSPEIQTEWVASGQVIQFVTVMILLSVVMALGLAGILKENTLGTLLGGIAGYVLAQGVGRAAAREVTRGSVQNVKPVQQDGAQPDR